MARREAIFKMKLDSDDAVSNVKKLDKDFTSLRDTIEVDVSGSISAMEDRLYELAAAGKTNTKEFKQLQKQTADYKKVVIETDRSIDALAEQGRGLNTALSLAEGTVAGFQAFTGISAMLGVENEELLDTITKLQGAQGVLNSISMIKQQIQNNGIALTRLQTTAQLGLNLAVGKGSKIMKIFRVALISTGIGALVVGIGILIANFDKVRDAVQNAVRRFRNMGEGIKTVISIIFPFIGAIRLIGAGLEALGIIEDDQDRERTRQHKAQIKRLQKERQDREKNIEKMTKEHKEFEENGNFQIRMMKAQGASKEEIFKAEQKLRKEIIKNLFTRRDEKISINDVIVAERNLARSRGEWTAEQQKQANKAIIANNKIIKNSDARIKSLRKEIKVEDAKFKTEQEKAEEQHQENLSKTRSDARKKDKDDAEKLEEEKENKLAEIRRTAEDFKNQSIEDEGLRKKTVLETQHKRERQQLKEKFGEDTELLKKLKAHQADEVGKLDDELAEKATDKKKLKAKKERAQKLLKLENDLMQLEIDGEATLNKELEIAKAKRDALLAGDKLTAEEKNKINLEYAAKEVEIEKKKEDEKVEIAKSTADFKNDIQQKSFALASDLINLFAGESEESQRRAFNIQKGMSIAQATMDTYKSANAIFTSTAANPVTVLNPSAPFIAAGLAVGAGLANVAKIATQKFQGGGGGGNPPPDPPKPSASIQGASAGSFSIDQNQGSSSTDLNQDGSQANTGNGMATKVFVTEQDITNTQNKVKATEAISTF